MLGEEDGLHLTHGLLDGVVHDEVVVVFRGMQLDLRAQQALLDLLGRVGAALGQAALQLCPEFGAMKMRTASGRFS